jgi:hypothetical protein
MRVEGLDGLRIARVWISTPRDEPPADSDAT